MLLSASIRSQPHAFQDTRGPFDPLSASLSMKGTPRAPYSGTSPSRGPFDAPAARPWLLLLGAILLLALRFFLFLFLFLFLVFLLFVLLLILFSFLLTRI